MNRRQFLSLLPAATVVGTATAAVAGTATTAVAAAPKSLSLEEGLLSAWWVAPISRSPMGSPYLSLKREELRTLCMRVDEKKDWWSWPAAVRDLYYVAEHIQRWPFVYQRTDWVLWMQTEQGPMRLCPHSLRWFPYSPKTDAI